MSNSIKQFVLRFGKEHLRGLVRLVVIATECKKVAHFLVESFL